MGITPTGITAAFGQSTPAMQAKIGGARGTARRSPRRRAKAARSSAPRKRAKAARSSGKLKKGSAAAKAWGRKMKRLRKRR